MAWVLLLIIGMNLGQNRPNLRGMKSTPPKKEHLSSFGPGTLCSYELCGEYILARFMGVIPVKRIHLGAVYYLRLATLREAPVVFRLFNWVHFLPHRRASRPVYILQTRSRHRIFLKLTHGVHFKLRQAINKHTVRTTQLAA
jgi:hypothetical protein